MNRETIFVSHLKIPTLWLAERHPEAPGQRVGLCRPRRALDKARQGGAWQGGAFMVGPDKCHCPQ